MTDYLCDYGCKTVGEGIMKFRIPNTWVAEFDAYDGVYPSFCVDVEQIRKSAAFMELKLRVVENSDDEYAGCMVLPREKIIAFKIDCLKDLLEAIEDVHRVRCKLEFSKPCPF